MNITVTVLDVRGRGVQCALNDESDAFWLPRAHPAVVWETSPEIGESVTVRIPSWLVQKHQQLTALRHQMGLAFHQPPGFDPAATEGSLPMADQSNDLRGALFKNDRKESDRHPDYKGDITIGGHKFWLSGWIKEGKRGKYLSLAAKPAEEQRQEEQRAPSQQPNAYAAAKGKAPAAHGQRFDDETIPFLPDR